MSMGTKLPSGMFNTGYTQPYGSGSAANMYGGGFGGGTYDPMLGFGQASGMGTTYDYPTRYSADYTRYAQSGQPFNQPVMGYNTYGQIFAQPQRPPPSMGKGGGGFRPPPPSFGGKGGGYDPNRRVGTNPLPTDPEEQRRRYNDPRTGQDATDRRLNRTGPPTMGGKGGPQPENDGVTISYPGGSRTVPRFPERRSNQLGLTGGPGAIPPPLVGGVPADSVGGFGPGQLPSQERPLNPNDFQPFVKPKPVQLDQIIKDENIYNSPFGQLFGGLGGMPSGTQVTNPNQFAVSTADRRYDPTTGTTGPSVTRYFENPAYQQQMAFQQGNSEEATRNRIQRELNDAFTTGQRSGVPLSDLYRQQGELSNKLYGQYGLKPVQATTQGSGGGLGGMPKQTVDPYQGSYQISEIPYQQQQLLAQQQQISDRAPPGFMRNPNYNAARGMQEDLPRGQEDYLSRQAFIPAGGGFGRLAFQEGGQVPPDANMEMMVAETAQPEMAGEYDRLIQMTMQAILGQVESPDEVIQMFIDEFGVDAFRQLRDAVLKQQVPNAQTEGMVDGNGGGMDDQVMGMIGNQRPVAVSPGEYIVPADVVSGLGDGSSQAGADILDELNQAVRMTRTGTTQQPRPLMETLQQ